MMRNNKSESLNIFKKYVGNVGKYIMDAKITLIAFYNNYMASFVTKYAAMLVLFAIDSFATLSFYCLQFKLWLVKYLSAVYCNLFRFCDNKRGMSVVIKNPNMYIFDAYFNTEGLEVFNVKFTPLMQYFFGLYQHNITQLKQFLEYHNMSPEIITLNVIIDNIPFSYRFNLNKKLNLYKDTKLKLGRIVINSATCIRYNGLFNLVDNNGELEKQQTNEASEPEPIPEQPQESSVEVETEPIPEQPIEHQDSLRRVSDSS